MMNLLGMVVGAPRHREPFPPASELSTASDACGFPFMNLLALASGMPSPPEAGVPSQETGTVGGDERLVRDSGGGSETMDDPSATYGASSADALPVLDKSQTHAPVDQNSPQSPFSNGENGGSPSLASGEDSGGPDLPFAGGENREVLNRIFAKGEYRATTDSLLAKGDTAASNPLLAKGDNREIPNLLFARGENGETADLFFAGGEDTGTSDSQGGAGGIPAERWPHSETPSGPIEAERPVPRGRTEPQRAWVRPTEAPPGLGEKQETPEGSAPVSEKGATDGKVTEQKEGLARGLGMIPDQKASGADQGGIHTKAFSQGDDVFRGLIAVPDKQVSWAERAGAGGREAFVVGDGLKGMGLEVSVSGEAPKGNGEAPAVFVPHNLPQSSFSKGETGGNPPLVSGEDRGDLNLSFAKGEDRATMDPLLAKGDTAASNPLLTKGDNREIPDSSLSQRGTEGIPSEKLPHSETPSGPIEAERPVPRGRTEPQTAWGRPTEVGSGHGEKEEPLAGVTPVSERPTTPPRPEAGISSQRATIPVQGEVAGQETLSRSAPVSEQGVMDPKVTEQKDGLPRGLGVIPDQKASGAGGRDGLVVGDGLKGMGLEVSVSGEAPKANGEALATSAHHNLPQSSFSNGENGGSPSLVSGEDSGGPDLPFAGGENREVLNRIFAKGQDRGTSDLLLAKGDTAGSNPLLAKGDNREIPNLLFARGENGETADLFFAGGEDTGTSDSQGGAGGIPAERWPHSETPSGPIEAERPVPRGRTEPQTAWGRPTEVGSGHGEKEEPLAGMTPVSEWLTPPPRPEAGISSQRPMVPVQGEAADQKTPSGSASVSEKGVPEENSQEEEGLGNEHQVNRGQAFHEPPHLGHWGTVSDKASGSEEEQGEAAIGQEESGFHTKGDERVWPTERVSFPLSDAHPVESETGSSKIPHALAYTTSEGFSENRGSEGQTLPATVSVGKGYPEGADLFRNAVLPQFLGRAMMLLRDGRNQMQISLKPEFLGHVRMEVVTEKERVTLRLVAENPSVKALIEGNANELKAELRQHGLVMDRLDVLVSGDGREKREGLQEWTTRRGRGGQGKTTVEPSSPAITYPSGWIGGRYPAGEGRVDCFA